METSRETIDKLVGDVLPGHTLASLIGCKYLITVKEYTKTIHISGIDYRVHAPLETCFGTLRGGIFRPNFEKILILQTGVEGQAFSRKIILKEGEPPQVSFERTYDEVNLPPNGRTTSKKTLVPWDVTLELT